MIKRSVQNLVKKTGFDSHGILFGFFERNAKKNLVGKCKIASPATRKLLQYENERHHYGDFEIAEKASEYILRSFTIDRIEFIEQNTHIKDQDIVIDLGDSNGIFLRCMNKRGISVNISDPALKGLRNRGMEVVKAHIEFLPFKTGSVHTVLLFETLEHVPNPVALLNEIGRVCSDNVILSIPWVKETHIHSYNYDPGRPLFQHHIFEFNKNDLARIVSHTPFSIATDKIVVVLEGSYGFFDRILFFLWERFFEVDMFCGCFRQFYICKLCKKKCEELHAA